MKLKQQQIKYVDIFIKGWPEIYFGFEPAFNIQDLKTKNCKILSRHGYNLDKFFHTEAEKHERFYNSEIAQITNRYAEAVNAPNATMKELKALRLEVIKQKNNLNRVVNKLDKENPNEATVLGLGGVHKQKNL